MSIPGSRHASGARSALRQQAPRKRSASQPCSAATCGRSSAVRRPRRTISPSRPITSRTGSTGANAAGWRSTEISSVSAGNSSAVIGGKRGSSRAAATVISRTTAPSRRSAARRPRQPRSAPATRIVTNAPARRPHRASSGSGGSARPARSASSEARARSSNRLRSSGVSSAPAMVGLPPPDRVGPAELLIQEHARQLVREGEPREAPEALRLVEDHLRERLRPADGERHVAAVHLPPGRPVGELARGPLLAPLRERDEARPLGPRREEWRLVLHLPLLDPRVAPQPVEVLVTSRPERRILDAAYRDDVIAHQAYIPRSRCIAATRPTASM